MTVLLASSRAFSGRGHRSTTAALIAGLFAVSVGQPAQDNIEQDVLYAWPTTLWEASLFSDQAGKDMLRRLAELVEAGFQKYVDEILPRQLEGDAEFREHFESADTSTRYNEAFMRWQKMVFARKAKVRLDEVSWIGPVPPKLSKVSYSWPALYKSSDFKRLSKNIENQAQKYLSHLSKERFKHGPFRLFIWAELYRPGDFASPHAHTGAGATGLLAAANAEATGRRQSLALQDVRGVSPPFGQVHRIVLEEGHLAAFPSWLPHYFEPNPGNRSSVYFGFLLWPRGGPLELDWEDDPTGDYVFRKTTSVKRSGLINTADRSRSEL